MAYDPSFLPAAPGHLSVYKGLPTEDLSKSLDTMSQRHYLNLENLNQTSLAIGSLQLSGADKEYQANLMNDVNSYIDGLVSQGHLANSTAAVNAKVRDLMGDQTLQYHIRNAETERAGKEAAMLLGPDAFKREWDEGKTTIDPATGEARLLNYNVEQKKDWNAPKMALWNMLNERGYTQPLRDKEGNLISLDVGLRQYAQVGTTKGIFENQIAENIDNILNNYKSTSEYQQEKYDLMNHRGGMPEDMADATIIQRVTDMGESMIGTVQGRQFLDSGAGRGGSGDRSDVPGLNSVRGSNASRQITIGDAEHARVDLETSAANLKTMIANNAPKGDIEAAQMSHDNMQAQYDATYMAPAQDIVEKYWPTGADAPLEDVGFDDRDEFLQGVIHRMEQGPLSVLNPGVRTDDGLFGYRARWQEEAGEIQNKYVTEEVPHSFVSSDSRSNPDEVDVVRNSELSMTALWNSSGAQFKLTGLTADSGNLVEVGSDISGAAFTQERLEGLEEAMSNAEGKEKASFQSLKGVNLTKSTARLNTGTGENREPQLEIILKNDKGQQVGSAFFTPNADMLPTLVEESYKLGKIMEGSPSPTQSESGTKMWTNAFAMGQDAGVNYKIPAKRQSFKVNLGGAPHTIVMSAVDERNPARGFDVQVVGSDGAALDASRVYDRTSMWRMLDHLNTQMSQ